MSTQTMDIYDDFSPTLYDDRSYLCDIFDRCDDRTSEFRVNPSSAGLVPIVVSVLMGLDTHFGNDPAKHCP